jgi:hypothetical protein
VKSKPKRKARIVTDPITGLPVLTLGKDAPVLTSKEVAEIQAQQDIDDVLRCFPNLSRADLIR